MIVSNYELYENELKNRVSQKRFKHCVNVSRCAIELAEIYGEDKEKAGVAGLLHDITKEISEQEHFEILKNSDVKYEDLQKMSPKIWHGISGSEYVKQKFSITDESILNAIRYHTTGRKNMSMLEKIVFIADYISPEREWPDLKTICQLAREDIDKAALYKLSTAIYNCINRRQTIHIDTFEAYNQIVYENREEDKNDIFRKG